ncbi:MAG TPA: hypothetical protein VGO57_06595 [Verrucomicrobiae bacterium]|jgi:uncharacterized protein YybS (DUF2232 family)
MKSRDLFKLAVRILGLVFLYHGLSSIPVLFQGLFTGISNAVSIILMVGWLLVVAFVLLRFAPKIADYFYSPSEE